MTSTILRGYGRQKVFARSNEAKTIGYTYEQATHHRLCFDLRRTRWSGARSAALAFLECFADPRQREKAIYLLEEVLLLCRPAVLAGAETFVDILRFGLRRLCRIFS